MQCGGATVLIIMNKFLIGLRNYNLRTIVVIVFVLSIAVGFLSTLGGKSMALSMIATAILSTFLYLVFTTQAIENDEKALMCAKFELIAFLTLLVSFAFIYKEIAELNIESGNFTNEFFRTVYPMSFVSNLLYAFAFAYGVKSVIPKFRLIWFLYLFIIPLILLNKTLSLLALGSFDTNFPILYITSLKNLRLSIISYS